MERKRISREEARQRMQPILDKYNSLPDVIHPKAEFRKQMAEALKGVLIPGIAPHEATILNYVSGKTAPEYEETMAALEGMLEEYGADTGYSDYEALAQYGVLTDDGTVYRRG